MIQGWLKTAWSHFVQNLDQEAITNKIVISCVLAAIYFQRFYLKKSIFEHDPKTILYVCIYLALKVEGEELRFEPRKFLEEFPKCEIDENKLQEYEEILMAVLNFQFDAKNPISSLQSINYRIKDSLASRKINLRAFGTE